MIIVDPVALGDVACTRASPKWAFDRTGKLVQVPANTLAVTYDPSDLTKAPYALVEPAATNVFLNSGDMSLQSIGANMTYVGTTDGPAGQPGYRFTSQTNGNSYVLQSIATAANATYTLSYWLRLPSGVKAGTFYAKDSTDGAIVYPITVADTRAWQKVSVTFTTTSTTVATVFHIGAVDSPAGYTFDITMAMVELGGVATSYVPSTGSAGVRAADVIASGAGVVYSSAAIDVQTYSAATTYAKDALVYDPVAHNVFQSLIASNLGKALTDTTAWTPRGAINRWAMLDQYNNTQTSCADEILLVVSPQAIAQGLYVGNVYADEVRISVVDLVEGLVYSETKSLVVSNSASSFYNWAFKRIQRQDFYGTLKLPPYANALVTVSLRKVGGIAKCGMFAIGPSDDFGPSLYGLSTEGKDYSSTTFNFDGTSSTVLRPYAKRMTVDVMVDNDQIDYVQARLFAIRQKLVIWFGGPYGSTVVAGRYESFKNVIPYPKQSQMNLTIGGSV